MRQALLQNTIAICYKLQQKFITKCVSFFITKWNNFITKCVIYYKIRQYKVGLSRKKLDADTKLIYQIKFIERLMNDCNDANLDHSLFINNNPKFVSTIRE